jgi:hypothetical protein
VLRRAVEVALSWTQSTSRLRQSTDQGRLGGVLASEAGINRPTVVLLGAPPAHRATPRLGYHQRFGDRRDDDAEAP